MAEISSEEEEGSFKAKIFLLLIILPLFIQRNKIYSKEEEEDALEVQTRRSLVAIRLLLQGLTEETPLVLILKSQIRDQEPEVTTHVVVFHSV
jgi:hypothetical protein